jgi:MFS family permease
MSEREYPKMKFLKLDRNIFFVGLTSLLTDTTTKMIYAVMPLFLMTLGASKTEISLIEGIAESTASVLKALSGWWSDKIGKNKPFMIIGYGFTALLSPLFAFVSSPLQVLIIRFSERVGKGIRTAPRDSLVAGSSDEKSRGKSFGFHKAMDNSGAIIGPLLAFGILSIFPGEYRRVFLFAAIPGLLGLFTVSAFIKEAKKSATALSTKITRHDFSKKYYWFLAIVFVFTLGNSTDALLLIKASDVGVADALIPILFMVVNGVSVFFSMPAGILSDKIGRERLIIFGYLMYAAIYFGFGRVQQEAPVFLLFALYGLYSAATDGIQKALVSDLVDSKVRGTGLGLYNCLVGVTLLPALRSR